MSTALEGIVYYNFSNDLPKSLIHLNSAQQGIIHGFGVNENTKLPCWFSQERISKVLFQDSGVEYLKQVENHFGRHLWAIEFSNVHTTFKFNEPEIQVDRITYPSVEAYFQSEKFNGMLHFEEAKSKLLKSSPHEAFGIGRSYPLRPDWEDIKVEVMRKGIRAKFTQNFDLKQLLLSTGNHPLVQVKPSDSFWGTGKRGDGRNMLGVLLQQLRKELGDKVA
ncbi:hypothetical protein HDV01_003095 [Terramyces sp. JEL0728]|nr:hypothetical protein HDV01_003095 [Terramyces sp. JEL0728]